LKTVDRFLARGFFYNFLVMLAILCGIVLISEALLHTDKLEQENFGLLVLGQFLVLRLPGFLTELAPFAVLLATLVFLGDLSRHAELTALRAGGVSLGRIARPLLLGGVAVAAASFGLNERVVGPMDQLAQGLMQEVDGEAPSSRWLEGGGVWFRDGPYVVSAARVARSGRELSGVHLYRLGENGLLKEILSSPRLEFRRGGWHLGRGIRTEVADLTIVDFPQRQLALQARPEVMAEIGRSPERMGFMRLWEYVDQVERQGQPTGYLSFTLWQKITLPLACAVMVLVATPFVSLNPRGGGRVGRLVAGIGVGFAFHASNVLVEQLSVAGGLPPAMAAWLPLAVFSALGGLLLMRMG